MCSTHDVCAGKVEDLGTGEYRCRLVATQAGQYTIAVTCQGQHVAGSPVLGVEVAPGDVHPGSCWAAGPGMQQATAGLEVRCGVGTTQLLAVGWRRVLYVCHDGVQWEDACCDASVRHVVHAACDNSNNIPLAPLSSTIPRRRLSSSRVTSTATPWPLTICNMLQWRHRARGPWTWSCSCKGTDTVR